MGNGRSPSGLQFVLSIQNANVSSGVGTFDAATNVFSEDASDDGTDLTYIDATILEPGVCGDYICHSNQTQLAPAAVRGVSEDLNTELILAGIGYAALDIGKIAGGQIFGTRVGGNRPLLNSNDFLRVGWSHIRETDEYVFRIGGDIIDGEHINLWPPSWWFGKP